MLSFDRKAFKTFIFLVENLSEQFYLNFLPFFNKQSLLFEIIGESDKFHSDVMFIIRIITISIM